MAKLNAYFKLMLAAKKSNKKSFVYKGKTYTQKKTKTGLVTYKKAGAKTSKRKSKSKRKSRRKSRRK
tara:strand:- start:826 stop:1026 length:201 start_codon:yes stop_codon:yes gene_type:complete